MASCVDLRQLHPTSRAEALLYKALSSSFAWLILIALSAQHATAQSD
jgi:hypothetical protein